MRVTAAHHPLVGRVVVVVRRKRHGGEPHLIIEGPDGGRQLLSARWVVSARTPRASVKRSCIQSPVVNVGMTGGLGSGAFIADPATLGNIERFGLENGRVVQLNPARTAEIFADRTLVNQLLGNIGRFDAGTLIGGEE